MFNRATHVDSFLAEALRYLNVELLRYGPGGQLRLPTRIYTSDPSVGGVDAAGLPSVVLAPQALQLGHSNWRRLEGMSVSCLMVTRDRFEQAKIAIGCFRKQTWPNRELIILDTTETDELPKWVQQLKDPGILLRHIPGCADPLGHMRNLAIDCASGNFVCQWDDDDISHPARLEVQLAAMKATNATASFLRRELVWLPQTNRLCTTRPRVNENTVICDKSVMPRYPSLAKLEDLPLTDEIRRSQRVAHIDAPELYIYTVHGKNTWHGYHMETIWQIGQNKMEDKRYSDAIKLLSHAYPVDKYLQILPAEKAAQKPKRSSAARTSPKIICVVAVARTGTGVLLDELGTFSELFVTGEIFHPNGEVHRDYDLIPNLLKLAEKEGIPSSGVSDPALIGWVRINPGKVVDWLVDHSLGRVVVFKVF